MPAYHEMDGPYQTRWAEYWQGRDYLADIVRAGFCPAGGTVQIYWSVLVAEAAPTDVIFRKPGGAEARAAAGKVRGLWWWKYIRPGCVRYRRD